MLAMTLLGCSFTTPQGEEPIHGALWVDEVFANFPGSAMVVIANSPLPCEPEDTVDVPATAVDEVASAESWWVAQLQSAFTREGAAAVALWLGGNAAEGGEFVVSPKGWLSADAGQGGGAALLVEEAVLLQRDGALFQYEPTEFTRDTALTGTASATVGDTTAEVTFDLGAWRGTATAERCVNPALSGAVVELLQ
ncbi:hypothetical protein LBMAG42_44650 [Deltaproteobacteria bacterium]|nr:hypothetical protein LBMAG42_44650 [Deltaproteobacteria bacterium]